MTVWFSTGALRLTSELGTWKRSMRMPYCLAIPLREHSYLAYWAASATLTRMLRGWQLLLLMRNLGGCFTPLGVAAGQRWAMSPQIQPYFCGRPTGFSSSRRLMSMGRSQRFLNFALGMALKVLPGRDRQLLMAMAHRFPRANVGWASRLRRSMMRRCAQRDRSRQCRWQKTVPMRRPLAWG